MYNLYKALIVSLLLISAVNSQNLIFGDNFDSYNTGQQLVCQNPDDWSTWSNIPCDTSEDAYISTDQAFNSPNSLHIIDGNNIVYPINNLTTGWYGISFRMYIPSGSDAYFSILKEFHNNSSIGLEVLFPSSGTAVVNADGMGVAEFPIAYDTWMPILFVVDPDADRARCSYGEFYYFWDWSTGISGTDTLNQLGGVNFYGSNQGAGSDYYIDAFQFVDLIYLVNPFSDDFESYTAGEPLACQSGNNWQTGFTAPCYSDDPLVSDTYACNSDKSTVIKYLNVLGKGFGKKTSGTWYLDFMVYIPSGKTGYFTILSKYFGLQRAVEIGFNSNGSGELTIGQLTKEFTWTRDSWQRFSMKFDLDNDSATAWIEVEGSLSKIATWPYSQGGLIAKTLTAIAFWGISDTDEMYIDDFYFGEDPLPPVSVKPEINVPVKFTLEQNYPNPFNPSTDIIYTIPEAGQVTLTVYNFIGEKVITLADEYKNAGSYKIKFNADGLPSGIYFYQLKTQKYSEVRKMLLLK